jgi:hypothetical protein
VAEDMVDDGGQTMAEDGDKKITKDGDSWHGGRKIKDSVD